MSRNVAPGGPTAQPTCCQRPSSATTGPNAAALEITHAHRLRRKLEDSGPASWS